MRARSSMSEHRMVTRLLLSSFFDRPDPSAFFRGRLGVAELERKAPAWLCRGERALPGTTLFFDERICNLVVNPSFLVGPRYETKKVATILRLTKPTTKRMTEKSCVRAAVQVFYLSPCRAAINVTAFPTRRPASEESFLSSADRASND